MEENNVNDGSLIQQKKINRGIILKCILLGLPGAILLFVLIMVLTAPVKKIGQLNAASLQEDSLAGSKEAINFDPDLFLLKKEEAFLESKFAISKSDSISLSINLPDSIVSLEIRGVTIHRSRIVKMKLSNIFSRLPEKTLLYYIKGPLSVTSSSATILKEPVIFKQAPKDTAEAAKMIYIPDTTIQKEPVYISFRLSNDMQVYLIQTEKQEKGEYYKYILRERFKRFMLMCKDLAQKRTTEYTPWVIIEIPGEEATSVYRSLPNKALVSIKI